MLFHSAVKVFISEETEMTWSEEGHVFSVTVSFLLLEDFHSDNNYVCGKQLMMSFYLGTNNSSFSLQSSGNQRNPVEFRDLWNIRFSSGRGFWTQTLGQKNCRSNKFSIQRGKGPTALFFFFFLEVQPHTSLGRMQDII